MDSRPLRFARVVLEVVMRIAPFVLILCCLVGSVQAQFIPEKTFTLSGGNLGTTFLAKGDFNRDGKLDVLFSGNNSSELVVFPGNGTGGFGAPIVTPITGLNNPRIGLAGDLNGDGIPDAVVSGTDPITDVTEIGVLLADGTGKFKAPILFRNSFTGGLGVLGDFNGDGKVDLAIVGSPVVVFPGNGDGTFGSPVSSTVGVTSTGCAAVADFNKDGKMDLTNGEWVLLGKGDGTFHAPVKVVQGFCDVAVGDFNKDGIPDLVTADAANRNGVRIFLGDGTGNFKNSTVYSIGEFTGQAGGLGLAVDNFSGDTNLDIAVANRFNNVVTMLLGKGDGTFTMGKSFAVSTFGILSGDFNGDLKTDLAVQTKLGFSVLLGKGNGTFTAQLAQSGQTGVAIRLADFNGDGKVDEIEFGTGGSTTAVLLGHGDGTFGSPIPVPASCQSSTGVVADFNGDKKADVAVALGSGIGVCLGNGDGTFKSAMVFDAGVQHGQLLFGDFNHDGKLDLAASDVGGVSILLGNGDGTFQTAIPTGASNFFDLVTGDFNHDGKLDLAANSNNEITVLLGKGDGTFQAPVTSPNPNGSGLPAAGDLNKDGNLDLVTLSPLTNGLNILLGNGDGTFKAPTLLKVYGPETFQIRDVNGDGKLDLIVAAPAFLDVIFGNGDGTFQKTKNFTAPQGSASLAAADINGDGLLDVAYLTRIPNSSTLTVYLNQGH
jgi:hypothetical protein